MSMITFADFCMVSLRKFNRRVSRIKGCSFVGEKGLAFGSLFTISYHRSQVQTAQGQPDRRGEGLTQARM